MCRGPGEPLSLPLAMDADGIWRSDWQPLLEVMIDSAIDPVARAETVHTTLAAAIVDQARCVAVHHGVDQVGLCGGVFQNRVLARQAVDRLRAEGFRRAPAARVAG